MFERIVHMLHKEFRQIFRDPKMTRIIFLMPVIQLLVFGYAVTTDVKHVRTAVCDLDNSVASRELVARFVHSGYFTITARVETEQEIRELMDRGQVQAVLQINHGFGADVQAGKTAPLQIIVDGTDSTTAGIVLDYSAKITGLYSTQIIRHQTERLAGAAPAPGTVALQTRAWFNDNLESRNFYVPGVIAIIVMLITLMLTSMAVVREKEIGTMEQLMVTPIRPAELMVGKLLPFAMIGLIEVAVTTLGALIVFGVPFRGSPLVLLVSALLFLLPTLGFGLLLSTFSETQQQAMMGSFFFFMPAFMLSGFAFPIRNMPLPVQYLTYLNPIRYMVEIVRDLFLKGSGFSLLWPHMVTLLAYGMATFTFSAVRFRKRLD